ncbi:arsenate reductase (glutaredoxin) [Pyruvatibacter mobilis]|uniref:arsenate reductase (glutaredoxin) n=1 Tax=Pyruvatibacter mobilis TaxID=1712261 RepID=UPI003BB13470
MSVRIYHNPRCSKSRATLALLEENGHAPEVVEYLKTPPTEDELRQVLAALGLGPRDVIRTGEAAYKDNKLSDENLSDDQLIAAMVANPILIERPIVVSGGKAKIGRPPEGVLDIL